MDENDFITKMVEETMDSDGSGDEFSVSHLDESEKTKNIEAEYSSTRKCFILRDSDKTLEIPENWGPFAQTQGEELIVTKSDDPYCFIPVLESFLCEKFSNAHIVISSESSLETPSAA